MIDCVLVVVREVTRMSADRIFRMDIIYIDGFYMIVQLLSS